MSEGFHEAREYENLALLLAKGYPYDIRDHLLEILPFIGPVIAKIAIEEMIHTKIGSLFELWSKVKRRKEIQSELKGLLKHVDRLSIIYFSSKFENNQVVGASMIRDALRAELKRIEEKNWLSKEDKEVLRIVKPVLGCE